MRPGLGAVAAAAASLALLLLWPFVYSYVSPLLPQGLRPQHSFERLGGVIPVVADRGTVLEASLGLIASMLPLYLYARRRVALLERLEEQLTEFLAIYAGIAASSRTSYEALLRSAEIMKQPLGEMLERMARLYAVTGDIAWAYEEGTRGLPRRARLLARGAVVVARTGGDPARVLGSLAAYAREIRRLAVATRNRLSEYKLVVALASLTYAVAAGVVLALIEVMQGVTIPGGGGLAVSPGLLLGLYYYSLLVIVAASSVILARIIQGYTVLAPKYFILLLSLSTVALLASPMLVRGPG